MNMKKDITYYVCKVCGKEDLSKEEIMNCEKMHKCKHNKLYYYEIHENPCNLKMVINKYCNECIKELDKITFDPNNKKFMDKLCEFIKTHKEKEI